MPPVGIPLLFQNNNVLQIDTSRVECYNDIQRWVVGK